MIVEVVHCDRCNIIVDYDHAAQCFGNRISLKDGGVDYDVGSGRSSDSTADLDLCRNCLSVIARAAIKLLSDEDQKKILDVFVLKKV